MGGITSTRRVEMTTENFCYNDCLIPKTTKGCQVAAKKVHGSHVFQISGYSLHREEPLTDHSISSAVFDVGGFDWVIFFLVRFGYLGAFLELKSDEDQRTRVRASFHISLVDVTGSAPPHTMAGTNEFDPEPERSHCSGCIGFMEKTELEASPYLHDDRLSVECAITIDCVIKEDVKPSSSDTTTTDEHLLMNPMQEDADVVFEVDGEAFPAHRTVLAARSPVFKAELYGAMRENDTNSPIITIADIQPVVFEALLHFIYNGSLPAMDDLGRTDYIETVRHLLVAADRYAVDTLKSTCESILSENIDTRTVLTTLALADQHHCYTLNDACLQFIAGLGRVQIDLLMESQEYAELKANRPLALVELWEKICRLGRSNSEFHFGTPSVRKCKPFLVV